MNFIVDGKSIDISIKPITDKRFIRTYRSAGLAFICKYMEDFLINFQNFDDKIKRKEMVNIIYYSKDNVFDSNKTGTATRVYCLLKIIYSGRIEEVLRIASNSKWLAKNKPESVRVANNLLKRIIF